MSMKSASKAVRKMIREWCGIAYQRELSAELGKLHDRFHQWEAGTLSPFELSDAIHKFHQGPARDLYVRYEMSRGEDDWLVAGAIAGGLIKREEIPGELLEALTPALSWLKERQSEETMSHE